MKARIKAQRKVGVGSAHSRAGRHTRMKAKSAVLALALFGTVACEGGLGGKSQKDDGASDDGPNVSGDGDGDSGKPRPPGTDPGRVTIHRLNNTEYNNTVRDLLGTTLTPADGFPLDGSGAGFDNLAKVLTLSEPHLVAYAEATEALVADVLTTSQLREQIVPCDVSADPSGCIRTAVRALAPRAFRRPVLEDDLTRLFSTVDDALGAGDSGEQALTIALEALLLSPHFLFRVELDEVPTSLEPHPLSAHELANRLSYFLYSSMPDEKLFAAADSGTLHDPVVLSAQVERMLADEKSHALIDNFAGQWLYLRKMDEVAPDPLTFPGFDDELRASLKRETEMLFEQIVFEGLFVDQLLNADFTFANSRLASHYGFTGVTGDQMQHFDLTSNAQRPGGILAHGSILSVTSHASRTSPVLRGKWVMGQLLCLEVKPPPPDVNINLNEAEITAPTLREQLEQHRTDASCASCHQMMDPIGLGLEHYDAIGAYRETDGGTIIDASGELPDGSQFSGPADLRELIANDVGFNECLIKNLYTYALGRVPERDLTHLDLDTLDALKEHLSTSRSFKDLILGIVSSPTFKNRRGDPSEEPP